MAHAHTHGHFAIPKQIIIESSRTRNHDQTTTDP